MPECHKRVLFDVSKKIVELTKDDLDDLVAFCDYGRVVARQCFLHILISILKVVYLRQELHPDQLS